MNDLDLPKLTNAVKRMKVRIVLSVMTHIAPGQRGESFFFPSARFGPDAKPASIAWQSEYWQAWKLPRAIIAEGKLLPSFSSVLANKPVATADRKSTRLNSSH